MSFLPNVMFSGFNKGDELDSGEFAELHTMLAVMVRKQTQFSDFMSRM